MQTPSDGIAKWLAEMGVRDAPVPRSGVQCALGFFHRRLPSLPRSLRLAFLRAMDLSKPVRIVTLARGDRLVAFRQNNEDPLKLFYTKPGTGPNRLGLNSATRGFQAYRVIRDVEVLESRCGPALDNWTDDRRYVLAGGGGVQFIVPHAYACLELEV